MSKYGRHGNVKNRVQKIIATNYFRINLSKSLEVWSELVINNESHCGRRNPWTRLPLHSKNNGVFCHVTHDDMAFSEVFFPVISSRVCFLAISIRF